MAKPKSLPYDAPEAAEAYSVSLHSIAGGSDKIYELTIQQAGDGWVVNFANGRRGSPLKPGTKTAVPVGYAEARKILNSTLYSKVGEGYVPIGGSRFAAGMTAEAISVIAKESSGWLPQLLNPINDPEGELDVYIHSDEWVAEEKHNGERRFVIVDADGIRGGNRTGQTVALPQGIGLAAGEIGRMFVLDGEHVGDRLNAFDILSLDGESITDLPLSDRRSILEGLVSAEDKHLRITEMVYGAQNKLDLIEAVKRRGGEGVVFKRLSSPYVIGKPSGGEGDWMKFKNWAELSAIVDAVNSKRSVSLVLLDDAGERISVGNVTVPANKEIPNPGTVIEVRYLFAYEGGSLYQPAFEKLRSDIRPDECLASQRKFFVPAEDTDVIAPSPGR